MAFYWLPAIDRDIKMCEEVFVSLRKLYSVIDPD